MGILTYNDKNFLMDGEPYTIVSGAVHYFRIVPEYWEDRLRKLKACGFNTVETYTSWNLHEPREGEFDFSGILDIERFIKTAEDLGLNIILRPGPYICAELDFGGLPGWLHNHKGMGLRCYDEEYLSLVKRYYTELFSHLKGHFAGEGGGIIMLQIENEYGSFGDDKRYLRAIADIYRSLGADCTYFTSDGSWWESLYSGYLPEYLSTANFGSKPTDAFNNLKGLKPDQPLMCTEYWNGWFDHWYEEHHRRTADDTAAVLDELFDLGASVNIYMFIGGTNFGFTNGANTQACYEPTVTSYDYDALLTESGDMTPKYFAVKEVLERRFGKADDLGVSNIPKSDYGTLRLDSSADLFDNLDNLSAPVESGVPKTMESLLGDFGYVMYTTEVERPGSFSLSLNNVHDRAEVFFDKKPIGLVERARENPPIEVNNPDGAKHELAILLENMGRVNYGSEVPTDEKGILGGIMFGSVYHFGYKNYMLDMKDLSRLEYTDNVKSTGLPTFLKGELMLDEVKGDTFVLLDGFTKGFVTVNGFNIGRYFNTAGPQKTLYLPAPLLKKGKNEIIVFEQHGFENPEIRLIDHPILG